MDIDENTIPQDQSSDVISKATGVTQPTSTQESIKINYDSYIKMRELFVLHIRRDESRETDENWKGVKRNDLVEWYLNVIEDELESVDDLEKQKKVALLVIKRLTDTENVLIEMDRAEDDEPYLIDNPDFDV
uniref:Mcm6 C-terminal winged-helix domain-containing protein n=1 Tax=Panagrolaimus superbus TaxID=310955 RepID=A0A914YNP8_9BILA